MINPKELRQGNNVWVTFTEDQTGYGKDYVGEIVGIIENKVRVKGDWHWIELYGISPIPLSPEILEKAGFNRDMEGWYLSAYDKLYDPLEMNGVGDYSQRNTTIFAYKQGEHILRRGIRFVHELQNIHFTLTGQELTINLK